MGGFHPKVMEGAVTMQDNMQHSLVPADGHAAVPFDYAALDGETALVARDAAGRIKERMRTSIIDVGRDLQTVKGAMPHGMFGSWLAAEFGWTDRTAQNYMAAAEWADGKNEIISVLPPTAIYLLASPSTPEPARAEVIEQIRGGEAVTLRTVRDIVAQAREKARQEARDKTEERRRAKLSPEQVRKEGRSRAAREKRRRLQEEEGRRRHEEAERRTANTDRLAAIIVAALSGNREAADLAADCVEWTLGRAIIDGLTRRD